MRSLSVLLIGRIQLKVWRVLIEANLPECYRRQLTFSEPGEHKRLVDESPLPADALQSRPGLGGKLRTHIARILSTPDGRTVLQRPASGRLEKPLELVFGQCTPLSARIRILIRLAQSKERIRGKAPV
ncbi:MAG TPA: hypothetical protein PLM14_16425 [Candidatus Hydrogenedentes bacterium]|nr:hypothetical protein [Candidatus Hydrogenedentota bacterium]HQH54592.1 hypothetical protein [Candidatus Hydrogenedentota bacterium]